jgi:hypothetical protein
MTIMLTRIAAAAVLVTAMTVPASAQTDAAPAVTLPVEGRFGIGGEFTGTATVNKFELRNNSIVAIGFVRGTLRRGNRIVGTAVAGEVTWPVRLRVNNAAIATKMDAAAPARVMPAHYVLAQAEPCPVLQIGLGSIDVNLLGVNVSLPPIALNLSGDESAPLGGLVCQVLDLLGNVVGLVGLLNSILGLITGLLGGLLP